MSNVLYGLGRQGFLDGTIDWDTGDIVALLCNTSAYTLAADTDNTISDILSGIVATSSGYFASKTTTLGVADAADITWATVTGSKCAAIVIAQATGDSSTALLIAYIDTATGLPVTPNGGDITCTWDAGTNKIFKL